MIEKRSRRAANPGGIKVIAATCTKYAPSTYGLSDDDLWAEARRLWSAGWSAAEIHAVLVLPTAVGT